MDWMIVTREWRKEKKRRKKKTKKELGEMAEGSGTRNSEKDRERYSRRQLEGEERAYREV